MITVTIGVALVTLGDGWINGILVDIVDNNARIETGHVKVVTQTYKEQMSSAPNDLALLNTDELIATLKRDFPSLNWTPRIRFGGLLDFAGEDGITIRQVRGVGLAVDLSEGSKEIDRLDLHKILVQGRLPQSPDEILLSPGLMENLQVEVGDEVTLISSSMYGSMVIHNFTISGKVRFGILAMDRNMMIVPLKGIRYALNMEDAAGEILGHFKDPDSYNKNVTASIKETFNRKYYDPQDEFSPYMLTLRDQNFLNDILLLYENVINIFIFIFMLIMFIVLWNAGLLNGIRRYGEMGLRLAIGESANHIYFTSIAESVLVGLGGSVVGTLIGLGFAWYLQNNGFDITGMLDSNSLYMSNVIRAKVSTTTFYIGFIPGVLATALGAIVSGRGIYKRKTAQLFKELEV